jgi:hypothetical protein
LGCGLAVAHAHFDLPQQGYDLVRLVSLDGYDRLPPRWILSFHLVQREPATSGSPTLRKLAPNLLVDSSLLQSCYITSVQRCVQRV